MKIKLAFLLLLSFLVVSHGYAQKPNLPTPNPNPSPTPTTPIDYYGMGYKTGYNLIVAGNTSVYNNSVTAAAQSGNTDYYEGLLEGGSAGHDALMKPIKPTPQIGSYQISDQYSLMMNFTNGTFALIQYYK